MTVSAWRATLAYQSPTEKAGALSKCTNVAMLLPVPALAHLVSPPVLQHGAAPCHVDKAWE